MKALTSYGYFLLEYFKGHSLSGDRLLDSFDFQGLDEVDKALERGRGVILVAVHLGNWWAGATSLALSGYKLHIVAGVQFTEALTAHAKAANESWGLRVVSPGPGQYRSLITALRGNELIALPVDGDIFERGVEVPFFSGHVKAPAGPARLAAITGAAVIACRVIRTAPLEFRFEFSTVWEGSSSEENSERINSAAPSAGKAGLEPREPGFVKDLTVAIMNEQQGVIGAHLDQWCIFRDLWSNSGSSK